MDIPSLNININSDMNTLYSFIIGLCSIILLISIFNQNYGKIFFVPLIILIFCIIALIFDRHLSVEIQSIKWSWNNRKKDYNEEVTDKEKKRIKVFIGLVGFSSLVLIVSIFV